MVPSDRIRVANDQPIAGSGQYVLYWMLANRRPNWNPALERAIEEAQRLVKPLLIVETLRTGYDWCTLRFHRFAIQGMVENAEVFAKVPVTYVPFVEAVVGESQRVVERLAQGAALVIADTFPGFLLPGMVESLAKAAPVRCEVVDGCGLLPLMAGKVWERAVDFRRYLQRELRPHLARFPRENPLQKLKLPLLSAAAKAELARLLPANHPGCDLAGLLRGGLECLAVDASVGPGMVAGGWKAGQRALSQFLDQKLRRYADQRSDLEADAASGLSPWLHAGHVSVFQIVAEVWAREGWSPDRLAEKAHGSKEGWWGLSVPAEAFLDQVVTWRELGYHACHHRPGFDTWEAIPTWARTALESHAADPRSFRYSLEQLRASQTHDPLWNAAQRQLVVEGRMPNYLRMLWGKKVIEWTGHPQEALAILIELNNRYALDGCNPNSYTGILWCFGRFDRPWAPQRPIFGPVRYMSSLNTAKKMRVKPYLARWAEGL